MKLLLPLLCSSLLVGGPAVASGADAVLDTDGDALQRGELYYAVSKPLYGGGLTLTARNGSCPLNVALAQFLDRTGRALAFFPENPDDDTVYEGRTLNIKFHEWPQCAGSSIWTADDDFFSVTIGGSTSTEIGPHYSRFGLRRLPDSDTGYQIQPCPCSIGVSRPSCRIACGAALGIVRDGNNALLGFVGSADTPHIVYFVKVTSV